MLYFSLFIYFILVTANRQPFQVSLSCETTIDPEPFPQLRRVTSHCETSAPPDQMDRIPSPSQESVSTFNQPMIDGHIKPKSLNKLDMDIGDKEPYTSQRHSTLIPPECFPKYPATTQIPEDSPITHIPQNPPSIQNLIIFDDDKQSCNKPAEPTTSKLLQDLIAFQSPQEILNDETVEDVARSNAAPSTSPPTLARQCAGMTVLLAHRD